MDKTKRVPRDFNRRNFLKALSAVTASSLTIGANAFAALPEKYDYIIIGSGAGGGPLACRLAKAGFKVLVVEAGGSDINRNATVPGLHLKSTEDPKYAWDFFVKHYSNRSQHGDKFDNREKGILYPRTGVLGGCTVHNAMISLYPYRSDWTKIQRLTGDRNYHPDRMRRIYEEKVMEWHHTEQTPASLALKDTKLLRMYLAAAQEIFEREGQGSFLGLGSAAEFIQNIADLDPNSRENVDNGEEGLFLMPKSTKNGKRWSTRDYLLQTQRRYPNNLFIATDTMVTRILFENNNSRGLKALGIECLEKANSYEAFKRFSPPNAIESFTKKLEYRATKEVIVAGGAFNSPQLLMLSGIGEKSHLSQHGIETKLNLPGVGKNLQDRYEITVIGEMGSDSDLIKDCTFGEGNDPCMRDYNRNPKRAIYGSNGLVAGIKLKSKKNLKEPDLIVFGGPVKFTGYYQGYAKEASRRKDLFTWAILKGQTKNRAGTVTLNSKNPYVRPNINFKYFSQGERQDMNAMVEGLKFSRNIFDRYKRLGHLALDFSRKKEVFPGKQVDTRGEMENFIKKESWGHHASCTNKMGRYEMDKRSVVGPNFKVHGTQNLRVVDASVFPHIPGLFIVLPTYMMAEKAAIDILRDA